MFSHSLLDLSRTPGSVERAEKGCRQQMAEIHSGCISNDGVSVLSKVANTAILFPRSRGPRPGLFNLWSVVGEGRSGSTASEVQ